MAQHKGKIEIFEDRRGEHRFRIVASNGRIICSSEGYKTLLGLKIGIEALARVLMSKPNICRGTMRVSYLSNGIVVNGLKKGK